MGGGRYKNHPKAHNLQTTNVSLWVCLFLTFLQVIRKTTVAESHRVLNYMSDTVTISLFVFVYGL